MTKKKPTLPEKVTVYIAARGSGKILWEEEVKRRAIEKGKTVLVMRKEDSTDDISVCQKKKIRRTCSNV